MSYGFELRKLRLLGFGNKVSEITFMSGLNVIAGPTNTGKSYIFDCINFMLGGKDCPEPIEQAAEYHTIQLEIVIRDEESRTLERKLNGGGFKMYNLPITHITPQSKFTELSAIHREKNESVSKFLMMLSGFLKTDLHVVKNKRTKATRRFTFRSLTDFILVNEVEILSKKSPIYSADIKAKTAEESAFKLVISNNDDSNTRSKNVIENRNGFYNAQIEIISKLIGETQDELESLDKAEKKTLNEQIDRLMLKRNGLSLEIESLSAQRRKIWNSVQQNESKLLANNQLRNRFQLLREQYETDIRRLKFLAEGEHYFELLSYERCPECNQTIPSINELNTECGHVHAEQKKESYKKELYKIHIYMQDLNDTLITMEADCARLVATIDEDSKNYESLNIIIEDQLSPKVALIQDELSEILLKQKHIDDYERVQITLNKLIKEQQSLKNKLETPAADGEKKVEEKDYNELLQILTSHIKSFLNNWGFPEASVVDFDQKQLDIQISGKPRRLFGKGYRSISYSAFVLGLMEYCVDNNLPHSGFVVLDSPLTSYKEEDAQEDKTPKELQQKFFESLSSSKCQIIVIENEKPQPTVIEKINYIEFTKSKSYGRYGFFEMD